MELYFYEFDNIGKKINMNKNKVIKFLFQEIPGKDANEFAPIRLFCEMLHKEHYLSLELYNVFLAYISIESKELQSYLINEQNIAITIGKTFVNLLQKLPYQIQLVCNILNPQLKHSLAFQILSFNTTYTKPLEYFTNFMKFIYGLYETSSNLIFLEQISKTIFNFVLIQILQPRIIGPKSTPASARTAMQYMIFMLENCPNKQFAKLIFNFIFGFKGILLYRQNLAKSIEIEEIHPENISISAENLLSEIPSRSATVIKPIENKKGTALIKDAEFSNIGIVSNLLEDQEDSKFIIEHTKITPSVKNSPLTSAEQTQQGEEIELKKIKIDPIIINTDISEYNNEFHDPEKITTFLLDLILCEHGGYSNIIMQFIDKLFELEIKEAYNLLIFDHIKSSVLPKTNILKNASDFLKLFPLFTDFVKNIDYVNQSKLFEKVISGLNISLVKSQIKPGLTRTRSGRLNSYLSRDSCKSSKSLNIEIMGKMIENDNNYQKNAFIDIFIKKLSKMLENSMDENIFLASILLKLFSIPINPQEDSTITLNNFLIENKDENSILSILVKISTRIKEISTKLGKPLDAMTKKIKEIHRKSLVGMATPIKYEDERNERFYDAVIIFEEMIKEIYEIIRIKEEINGIINSSSEYMENCERKSLETNFDNPYLFLQILNNK